VIFALPGYVMMMMMMMMVMVVTKMKYE